MPDVLDVLPFPPALETPFVTCPPQWAIDMQRLMQK